MITVPSHPPAVRPSPSHQSYRVPAESRVWQYVPQHTPLLLVKRTMSDRGVVITTGRPSPSPPRHTSLVLPLRLFTSRLPVRPLHHHAQQEARLWRASPHGPGCPLCSTAVLNRLQTAQTNKGPKRATLALESPVPPFRQITHRSVHNLPHPGMWASRCLCTRRWIWRSMIMNINLWMGRCRQSQVSKISRHTQNLTCRKLLHLLGSLHQM